MVLIYPIYSNIVFQAVRRRIEYLIDEKYTEFIRITFHYNKKIKKEKKMKRKNR